jgi:hypothetical protein
LLVAGMSTVSALVYLLRRYRMRRGLTRR